MAIINIRYVPEAMPTNKQKADIKYAAVQWAEILDDDLSINVQVWAVNMTGTGLNAMCIPGFYQVADHPTLTRPQAKLLGAIASHDLNIDLVVVMDTETEWVLGAESVLEVAAGQYSLSTTIMHELCHGLGFLGLCNVYPPVGPAAGQGIYTAANTLIPLLKRTAAVMNPAVTIPENFFPDSALTGFAVITPFADLFWHSNEELVKGMPEDDYTAFTFMGVNNIISIGTIPAGQYTVLTANGGQFEPFITCDHIIGADYLMNPSTEGQYYAVPDASSRAILNLIGWTVTDN